MKKPITIHLDTALLAITVAFFAGVAVCSWGQVAIEIFLR